MVRLTADDFFTGLFAALVSKGIPVISIRNERFEEALAPVFDKLKALAVGQGLDLRFRIRLHPFHNDSTTVRDAIYNAAQSGLISLDNPEYQDIRFKISDTQALKMLEDIPGGKELFLDLAESFIENKDLITV